MLASSIPVKIPEAFANGQSSTYNNYPLPDTTTVAGAASWNQGFGAINATSLAAGGIPPAIQDINPALGQVSAWICWLEAGGPVVYDSAYSTKIGGYPKGAILESGVYQGLYFISTADNNAGNPDTSTTNWIPVYSCLGQMAVITASTSFVVPAGCLRPKITVIGGGGGGGGGLSGGLPGAGGGAGGYARGNFATTPGNSLGITIGAGGAAGASGGGAGGAGGTTSVGSLLQAGGGAGGTGGNVGGSVAGGSPGGGNIPVGPGEVGYGGYGGDGGTGSTALAGYGGASLRGGGGRPSSSAGGASNGLAYGSGGGGGYVNSVVGGAGASGVVVIEW